MSLLLQSLVFGLAILFILIGLVGTVIPILPGSILIWLSVTVYAVAERSNGFAAIDTITFVVITLIALVTGLADLWLPILGVKAKGGARRSILYGLLGALIGTFILPLFGSLAGYVIGVLLGEYHKWRDWDRALRAAGTSLATWGVATVLQLGGGILILLIFLWQVLSHQSASLLF